MMIDVSRLRIAEDVCIQPEALTILQSSLDDDGSHDVIERAVIEVAERMGMVEQALMLGDLDKLRKSARGLGAIGEQLGFLLLARVAEDVIICAERNDVSALHSVTERLIRIGDASLAAAIDGATLPV
ncbi:MAG: hypothetical protein GXP05_07940 [Alphaproteobacteria bacterium]|nr:hypothetical protein [Alphaproteobacteria bacterium]